MVEIFIQANVALAAAGAGIARMMANKPTAIRNAVTSAPIGVVRSTGQRKMEAMLWRANASVTRPVPVEHFEKNMP